MVPGQALVQAGLSQNQSSLRTASTEYCDAAVDAGWVKSNSGLAGLANTLINGITNDQAQANTYAARIGAGSEAPALVLARIVSDSQAARTGLGKVSREADSLLEETGAQTATRADVMSYERALVRAQMAYRSFQSALGEVAARPDMDMDTAPVDKELGAFEDVIDDARETADRLAEKYASVNSATS
ncbi:putative lipoprotein [Hyphomonas adhaerens MHS-3]|uniref:Putative lipoprotein n=1 Tax=Hyphomonas adhaerens MHS-3 TaxID=1280949 RepID=A0A069E2T5_9PROT|nr:putative lipoprotein [Hyphomonas adhaerens MHS-3]|tara:strand:+ start:150 stop:710 length:561 start_codon:yes stop_codon:yes gene_type:complete